MSDEEIAGLRAALASVEAEIAKQQVVADWLRQRLEGLGASGDLAPPQVHQMGGSGSSQPGRIKPDEFFRMSIPDAIQRYLAIMKQPQGPKAIVEGIQAGGVLSNAKHFYANVTTALKRLRIAEKVVLTPNGWGLAEWYPSKPKAPENARKGRRRRRLGSVRSAKPKSEATGDSPRRPAGPTYREFLSEQMRSGRSMSEAAAAWKARQPSAD